MPKIMNMPKIGVNMTEATIVEWVVKVGDLIKLDDHIFDAETDKATQEINSTEEGILAKILVEPGETVECQEPIAVFTEQGEELPKDFLPDEKQEEKKAVDEQIVRSEGSKKGEHTVEKGNRMRISPLAKKTAQRMGLDFTRIQPAVPGARVVKADVLAFAELKDEIPAADEKSHTETPELIQRVIPVTGVRRIIAERMAESSRTNARTILSLRANAANLIEWRNGLKEKGHNISYNVFLAFIVSKALRKYPIMNSIFTGDEIKLLNHINIGVAVDSERGLLVPVLKNADRKGLLSLSSEFIDMVDRAKDGRSTPGDLQGGTFTITNLGMIEIESFVPIINPPECGILGVGAIIREPVVNENNDSIEIQPLVHLTLAFDHRVVDGFPAGKFLQSVKHMIETPTEIMS